MKALGILVILFNSIFAGEAKSDSSLLKLLNALKRQKLFYSANEKWLMTKLIDTPSCIGAGCCLIPWVMASQPILTKKDSVEHDTTRQKKWGFGIGYAIGLCYISGPLAKFSSEWTFDPVEVFTRQLYWLHLIEGGIAYKSSSAYVMEFNAQYGWSELEDRIGLEAINGFNSCHIRMVALCLKLNSRNGLLTGIEFLYGEAQGRENYENTTVEVVRRNLGGGFFAGFSVKAISKGCFSFRPFVIAKISLAEEFSNTSPWKAVGYNEEIDLNFSGVYVGIKLSFGGVR